MTNETISDETVEALMTEIEQRAEVERRMAGRHHEILHVKNIMLNRRKSDIGYVFGNGAAWTFENLSDDAVLPVVLADLLVAS